MNQTNFALPELVGRRPILQAAAAILVGTLSFAPGAQAADPIKIGLVTALSGQSARAGEAITRGATIAIEEINAKGGVLGRPLELVRRDDEHIAGGVQLPATVRDAGQQPEFGHGGRRVGLAVAHDGCVQRPIAVEEDCSPKG